MDESAPTTHEEHGEVEVAGETDLEDDVGGNGTLRAQLVEDPAAVPVRGDVPEVQGGAPEAVAVPDAEVQDVVVRGPVTVVPDLQVRVEAEALRDVCDPALPIPGLPVGHRGQRDPAVPRHLPHGLVGRGRRPAPYEMYTP